MKKLIVCVHADDCRMGGTGAHGHETKIKPYREYVHTDHIIDDGDALDLIMQKVAAYQYQVYGGSAIYLDVTKIRKRLNRAFYKEAFHHYKMTKSQAKAWSRAMASGYFHRDGFPIGGMIEEMRVEYENDFSQASFDAFVIEEISCW